MPPVTITAVMPSPTMPTKAKLRVTLNRLLGVAKVVVSSIIASVVRCLAKAPPELAQDFLVRGMYLVGGGGLLRGLAQRIEKETQVPVRMSNMPLEAVVMGAGHCIEHYDALKGMFMGARR